MDSKTCTKCGETKPLDEFHKQKDAKYGHKSRCTNCTATYQRAQYVVEPEKYKDRSKAYYVTNKEKKITYTRAWRKANPEKAKALSLASNKAWRESNPEKYKAKYKAKRFAKYEMTELDYLTLLEGQDNVCGCCGSNNPKTHHGEWCIDHNHDTGLVLGIVCQPCNLGKPNCLFYLAQRIAFLNDPPAPRIIGPRYVKKAA